MTKPMPKEQYDERTNMSAQALKEALDGPAGSIDGYLESRNEGEIRNDIRALCAVGPRAQFAAMALQGMLASETEEFTYGHIEKLAKAAVERADALLAALAQQT